MQLSVHRFLALAALLPALFVGSATVQAEEEAVPSGHVYLSGTSIGLIIGGGKGGGRLVFKDRQYAFSIGGFSFGAIAGGTTGKMSGEVYNLNNLADFNGKYSASTARLTVVVGAGGMWLENEKGVVMRLDTDKSLGVALNIGVGGVTVELAPYE